MKIRIDILLVERNLVSSRSKAQRLLMANQVTVNGTKVTKPGTQVTTDAEIAIAKPLPYVSRGGFKLAAALDTFQGVPLSSSVIERGALYRFEGDMP